MYIQLGTDMGRPPKPENERRSKMLPLRLTEDEWRNVLQASKETGISVSEIFREGAVLFIRERNKGGSRKQREEKQR